MELGHVASEWVQGKTRNLSWEDSLQYLLLPGGKYNHIIQDQERRNTLFQQSEKYTQG